MLVKFVISFLIGLFAAVFAVINHAELWLGIVIFVLVGLITYCVMMLIGRVLNKTANPNLNNTDKNENNRKL